GGVLGGERQVALQLEADHLAHVAGHRRQVDGLDRHHAAGQREEGVARRQPARFQLGAQGVRRVLGLDDERLDARAAQGGDREAVTEQDDREPERLEVHSISLRDKPAICKTFPGYRTPDHPRTVTVSPPLCGMRWTMAVTRARTCPSTRPSAPMRKVPVVRESPLPPNCPGPLPW